MFPVSVDAQLRQLCGDPAYEGGAVGTDQIIDRAHRRRDLQSQLIDLLRLLFEWTETLVDRYAHGFMTVRP
jgi:hypothetical protein